MAEATIRCSEEDLRSARQICERVLEAERDRVSRVLFHGSRVSGRPRRTSDFDILVVVRDPVEDWVADSLRLLTCSTTSPGPSTCKFSARPSTTRPSPYPARWRILPPSGAWCCMSSNARPRRTWTDAEIEAIAAADTEFPPISEEDLARAVAIARRVPIRDAPPFRIDAAAADASELERP
jgi:hypothetical protein